jgi:esterase/lipase
VKKVLSLIAALLLVLAGIMALGPREPVEEVIADLSVPQIAALDGWLAERESGVENLRPGAEKSIVWANPASKARTDYAVVYLHGFSANREEIRPLPDIVAKELGANLHFARLTGHGRDGAAMAEATANAWLNDTAEALSVGRTLGEKVIIISTSTGGTLATWALSKGGLAEDIAGTVMVSPNFGVAVMGSEILGWPWARQIIPLIFGEERGFEPVNEDHARHWTTSYPSVALLPMQATVSRAKAVKVEEINVPALFVIHPEDKVVRSDVTLDVANRWGGPSQVVQVRNSEDPYNHVIAGRILSPSTTQSLANRVIEWAGNL